MFEGRPDDDDDDDGDDADDGDEDGDQHQHHYHDHHQQQQHQPKFGVHGVNRSPRLEHLWLYLLDDQRCGTVHQIHWAPHGWRPGILVAGLLGCWCPSSCWYVIVFYARQDLSMSISIHIHPYLSISIHIYPYLSIFILSFCWRWFWNLSNTRARLQQPVRTSSLEGGDKGIIWLIILDRARKNTEEHA